MTKITAIFLSIITTFGLFFGNAGDPNYMEMTSFKESLHVLFNKKEVIAEKHTGTVSDYRWSSDEEYKLENTTVLQKEKDRDFKILTLSDIHFSDYGYRAFLQPFNVLSIKRVVAEAKPDLIIMPGDIVCDDEGSDYYSIRRVTDLMESFGIPWAPVFGNHDDESNCDLNFLAETMMSSPHCLMQKGDPEMGVGNYIINIAEGENVVESLILMDSHHDIPNAKQTEWFKWAADGINRITDGKAEISVYMHIPLPEYQLAYDEAWNADAKKWNDGYDAYGSLHEKVCCAHDADGNAFRSDLFKAMKECGTAKYVFCGHEHMNNFSINYEGIRLTYTMKLGKCSGFQIGFNGGTSIIIGSDGISRITHKTLSFGPFITLVDIDTSK